MSHSLLLEPCNQGQNHALSGLNNPTLNGHTPLTSQSTVASDHRQPRHKKSATQRSFPPEKKGKTPPKRLPIEPCTLSIASSIMIAWFLAPTQCLELPCAAAFCKWLGNALPSNSPASNRHRNNYYGTCTDSLTFHNTFRQAGLSNSSGQ